MHVVSYMRAEYLTDRMRTLWSGQHFRYTQPLNLVNLYGYGRLCWNTSMTKEEIYHEWLGQTFATTHGSSKGATTAVVNQMLISSEGIATLLGIYHGYRGVCEH